MPRASAPEPMDFDEQNPKPDIRLLLADVDGTLVTQDKVLTEQAVAATRELRDAGITLALTSGRPPRGMSMLIAPLRSSTARSPASTAASSSIRTCR